ncbi:c-type cytochrome biogenesis protein CcsB [Actinoallomurus purpureus]|uniref:c-type cytochrome biogenesis protein CcsB n=1 Tax=Actinoallomurus purpureus TaxID=478114 RepID=UPI00209262C3|nr:c-type cytochrome biogenesis protein CcsB [Actinoallomurus purpureus]MCO6004402.1 c-type cytochrome biogenesis protein CcsB [Actinoallomurus purpureus]
MVDTHLANLSNQLMLGAVLLYVVAMVGYAADIAFGGRRAAAVPSEAKVLIGAGGPEASEAATDVEEAEDDGRRIEWGRFAVLINVLAWGVHGAEIITRGMAADRVPWGNMYEFTSAITFAAVTVYLVMLWRYKVSWLGPFLMVAVIIALGIATIWLYNDPGPLRPALHSYWIAIHVTAAVTATGTFTVAGVATILYLVKARDKAGKPGGIMDRVPDAETLDRISHRTMMFGFPIWTFAIIAGAIWADSAWGRYWGWDPKETWSFITWVVYAGYLHARATAGWRGRKAAVISLIAFGCLLFNFFGINYLVSGLHSYAG